MRYLKTSPLSHDFHFTCRWPPLLPKGHHLQGVPLQRLHHGEELHQLVPGRVSSSADPQRRRQEERAEDWALPGVWTDRSFPLLAERRGALCALFLSEGPCRSAREMKTFILGCPTPSLLFSCADHYSMCLQSNGFYVRTHLRAWAAIYKNYHSAVSSFLAVNLKAVVHLC